MAAPAAGIPAGVELRAHARPPAPGRPIGEMDDTSTGPGWIHGALWRPVGSPAAGAGEQSCDRYSDDPVRVLQPGPWAWPWSTLRDLGGAIHQPWTSLAELAGRLRVRERSLLERVSTTADHRPPIPASTPILAASLVGIRSAVAAALRLPKAAVPSDRLGRRLVVQAARAIGRTGTPLLAADLGVADRTVRGLRHPTHPALDAVLLCLGDPRLHG